jgi:hypothetical protein
VGVKEGDFPAGPETDPEVPIELSFDLCSLISKALFNFSFRNVVHVSRSYSSRHVKLIEGIAG